MQWRSNSSSIGKSRFYFLLKWQDKDQPEIPTDDVEHLEPRLMPVQVRKGKRGKMEGRRREDGGKMEGRWREEGGKKEARWREDGGSEGEEGGNKDGGLFCF
jgi:hypothetical protein